MLYKWSFVGAGGGLWLGRRMSNNMSELEKNTKEKALFDPVKAKAQIEIYKEIYRLEDEELNAKAEGRELTELEREAMKAEKDGALRILQTASTNDLSQIQQFFEKSDGEDSKSDIEREMEKLRVEIESLEEVNSTHQGYKFYKAAMTKDIFEDALIELREKQYEKKFKAQQE